MERGAKAAAIPFAAAALLVGASQTAHAGAFALREQSTIGLGQAFAGAAAGGAGLGSMYWNPATMTQFMGLQVSADLAGIMPNSSITPTSGTSPILTGLGGSASTGDIVIDAFLPSAYASYQINDKFWVGLAVNAPYGLITKNPFNAPGQIYARTSEVRSYEFTPQAAWAVTDWLSVGAGVQALHFNTRLTQALSPLPNAATGALEGDAWAFGATAGVTIKPFAGTEIGIGYRSTTSLDLEGSLSLGAPTGSLPAGSYGIAATLNTPDMVSVGIRQTVTPDLVLSGAFEWYNWSRFGTIPVTGNGGITNGMTLTSLPFEYDDSYYASIGAEYRWNKDLTLRAGTSYEWSPISTRNRDLRLPDSDRISLAVGGGYQITESLKLDLAYMHIFAVGDGDVELTPGNPHYVTGLAYTGKVDSHVDIVSASVSWKFDGFK
ncbi:OmpP1/FadL family transporter [Segnochrobactraceae bacterium EtOH-i3]